MNNGECEEDQLMEQSKDSENEVTTPPIIAIRNSTIIDFMLQVLGTRSKSFYTTHTTMFFPLSMFGRVKKRLEHRVGDKLEASILFMARFFMFACLDAIKVMTIPYLRLDAWDVPKLYDKDKAICHHTKFALLDE